MSRQDYIRIAAAITEARKQLIDDRKPLVDAANFGISLAAQAMADELARDNPRFDRGRFLAACHA